MRGMKGYGPSLIRRDDDGHELVGTGELVNAFGPITKQRILQVLKRGGVVSHPTMRGPNGEALWRRRDAIPALVRWNATRRRRP